MALSSLPQTACRPSLQGKERSHSLPLVCKPQLRVSRQLLILRRAPTLCSQGAHVVAIHPAGKDPNIPSCEPAHSKHHPRPQTQLTELWNQWVSKLEKSDLLMLSPNPHTIHGNSQNIPQQLMSKVTEKPEPHQSAF